MSKYIEGRLQAIKDNANAIVQELLDARPVGTRVGVLLSSSQIHPTPATIRGACVNGWFIENGVHAYYRVEIDNAKRHSRYRIRSISIDDVRDL